MLALLVALALAGCGDDGEGTGAAPQPARAKGGEEPEPALGAQQAYGAPQPEVQRAIDRWRTVADEAEGTARGVKAARRAAELERVLALRTGDDARLDRARELLRRATRDEGIDGACEAALALARLEARDAGDPTEAYAVAYRATRRFASPGETGGSRAECLAGARRMLAVIEAFRPSAERLAGIDADPHGDEGTRDGGPDVTGWLEEHGETAPGAAATLRHLDVYGASGEDAPSRGGIVRVVLELDRAARFERGELAAEGSLPRRFYLDFPHTERGSEVPRTTRIGAAGVERVRTGVLEPGVTRVVFDLDGPVRDRLFFLTDPYRVVIDFERPGTGAASAGASAPIIVLDPGHGGDDYGTRFDGLVEADLALDLAERVERILARRLPKARVLLTRDDDVFVSLEQRTAFANAADADAFVSIHINAAEAKVARGGVATFVLDTNDDEQALRLAARENATSTDEVTELQRLLAGLHRQGQVGASRELAGEVQHWMVRAGRRVLEDLPDRGVKEAMFYVLVGARMPAILVEASFLTQPREAEALKTDEYRQALADGIAEGIVRHFGGGS
ncbi:MAG: N-acetylmuramoyl-L-alanine amidase [Polyangiales bacterium]